MGREIKWTVRKEDRRLAGKYEGEGSRGFVFVLWRKGIVGLLDFESDCWNEEEISQ